MKELPMIGLHEKYGSVVRLGPSCLSFDDPQARRDIYGSNTFAKSEFYPTAAAVLKGKPTPSLFSSTDATWHDDLKRKFKRHYSLSSVASFESALDERISKLISRIAEVQQQERYLDLSAWMELLTYDVIAVLTFGEHKRLLENGADVDSVMSDAGFYHTYNQIVGQMPLLHNLILKNPILSWLERTGYVTKAANPLAQFAAKQIRSRAQQREQDEKICMLDVFLREQDARKLDASEKVKIHDGEIQGMLLGNMLAGSVTTSISLSTALFEIMKHPDVYRKLRQEVDDTFEQITCTEKHGEGQKTVIPLAKALEMEYLSACILEGQRLHPPVRFSPERVTPSTGATIAGEAIPGGTIVSTSPWLLQRHPAVFGNNAQSFVPERWLHEQSSKGMRANMMTFGPDKYRCIGEDISRLEIVKVLPTLLYHYDLELVDPAQKPEITWGNTVSVKGINVRFMPRTGRQ